MIGQILADRYEVKELKDAGRTLVAEDTHRPGYPLCLIQRLQGQAHDLQGFQIAKLILEQRVEAIKRLGEFDQIPGVLTFFEIDQVIYLVEELINGYPLSQELIVGQPWTEEAAIALMQEILEILKFMHHHDVVLRGLRPDNLMRRQSDGKLVLINLLMLPPKNRTLPGQTSRPNLMTLYQAPEQLEGNPIFSSNFYSLGMIVLQAVTGLPPESLLPAKSHWRDRANVSQGFAAMLDRLLSDVPADRYRMVADILKAIQSLNQATSNPNLRDDLSPLVTIPLLKVESAEASTLVGTPSIEARPQPEPAPSTSLSMQSPPAEAPTVLNPTPIPSVTLDPPQPPVAPEPIAPLHAAQKQLPNAPEPPPPLAPTVIRKPWWRSKRVWGITGGLAMLGTALALHFRLPQNTLSAYHLSQGNDRGSRSLYKGAIGQYNEALRWNKENAAAFFHRGYAFYQLRNFPQALNDFTQTIALEPASPLAFSSLLYRGNIRMSLGDSQGAVRDYNQAIEVDSTEALAFVQRGQAENAMGKAGNALKSYSQAIRLDPNLAAAYLNRCLTKSNLNDQPGAIADCSEATGINPNLITAYQNRGLAYHRAGNYRNAIADLNVAIKLDGEDATSYYQRGLIRLDLQDREGAISDFNTAIQFKSDHVFAYYQRGLVQEKYGNLDGAIGDLEMAMKLCVEQGMTGCYRDAQYHLKRLGKIPDDTETPTKSVKPNANPVFGDSYSPSPL